MFSSVRPSLSAFFLAVLRRAPGVAKLEGARARAPRVRFAAPRALGVFPTTLCVLVGALRSLHFCIYSLRFRRCHPLSAFFSIYSKGFRLCAHRSRRFSGWSCSTPGTAKLDGARVLLRRAFSAFLLVSPGQQGRVRLAAPCALGVFPRTPWAAKNWISGGGLWGSDLLLTC